jgi:hypothetical protein
MAADRSVWPWDQAWFGAQTVALYETARADPLAWPDALLRATPIKPPAVAWIGQFFVPLGTALGSVDAALRLSVWACQLTALLLVYRALMALAEGRAAVAAAGTLVVGAAPMAVVLSTQYLAEASQTLAVAWFVLLMTRAREWHRARLGAHLVAATAFALLAKTTSPLYCTAPGLIALYGIVRGRARPPSGDKPSRGADWTRWILALTLAAGAAAWYARNSASALQYASTAAFGPVAELFGGRSTFGQAYAAWIRNASAVFFMRPIGALLTVLVAAAVVTRLARRARWRHLDTCAAAALVQVGAALAAFALSPNRDPRFAAPLLPLLAVAVGWAMLQPGLAPAAPIAASVLAVQLLLVQAQVLGWRGAGPLRLRAIAGIDIAFVVAHADRGPAAELEAIVERTCGRGGFGAENFVGVELLRLNAHSLTYTAAKERLAGRAGACQYHSATFGSVDDALALASTRPFVYWIAVDPEVRPVPPHLAAINQSAPIVLRRLRRRHLLEPEPWHGPPGVLLFRFVSR